MGEEITEPKGKHVDLAVDPWCNAWAQDGDQKDETVKNKTEKNFLWKVEGSWVESLLLQMKPVELVQASCKRYFHEGGVMYFPKEAGGM